MLLARWLITEPRLLILDEPTRGIDVGAKAEIQRLVVELSDEGMAVLFVSRRARGGAAPQPQGRRCCATATWSPSWPTTTGSTLDRLVSRRSRAERAHERQRPPHRHRLFWPLVMLVVLLLANVVFRRASSSRVRDGHLYGSLIDIVRFGAPLMLVALGMTFVIATGGIDLSVGSVVAISGALSPAC